ncbi:HEAT repeat domain-containing protein [Ideonella sp. DXS29W]|uniref:HEAT repeat domain-containing protein n=1 Tax=Ideonella lacteola TaxID=2984193 RepID=A0ABU9BUG7_9BURK
MKTLKIVSALLMTAGLLYVPAFAAEGSSQLLASFQTERDVAAKELILDKLTQSYPDAGPALLEVARSAGDSDTAWLAIRGIGHLRFKGAVPFLAQSLSSKHAYVRANSARALGEIKDTSVTSFLMQAIKNEKDGGVIEQMSLALTMLHAVESVAVLKTKALHSSAQTRTWVVGAVADLGKREDVPFLATYLDDKDHLVAMRAAEGIEQLTGQDFGFPPSVSGPPSQQREVAAIQRARTWWRQRQAAADRR